MYLIKFFLSFLITVFFQILFFSIKFFTIKPSFINLILIYWIIYKPEKISTKVSFILGIFIDLIFGFLLGTNAIAFSLINIFLRSRFIFLVNLYFFQTIIVVTISSFIIHTTIFFLNCIFFNFYFYFYPLLNTILDSIFCLFFVFLINRMK